MHCKRQLIFCNFANEQNVLKHIRKGTNTVSIITAKMFAEHLQCNAAFITGIKLECKHVTVRCTMKIN